MSTTLTVAQAQGRVERFMTAGGQAPEEDGPHIPRAHVVLRRLHMLREEIQELEDAYREGDIVEVADAIADTIVVALGAAVDSDINISPILTDVLRSNDTKINWDEGRPWATRADGKVGKDEHFQPVRIRPLINAQIKAYR